MSRKSGGSLLVLGSLLAVTALGAWGCCSVKCCDSFARIGVASPGGEAPGETLVISKKRHQEILWKLPDGSTISEVAITLGEHPAPFVACQTSSAICHIACEHKLCASGPINPDLRPPSGGIYYAYVFQSGSAASLDPGIRIDP
ncbi:MAG TPA: hypothetical protein VIY96_11735 [Thermoanaerobaculia bacterium]